MSVDAGPRPFDVDAGPRPFDVEAGGPEAFMLRFCGSCTTLYAPDAWVCGSCDGDLEWVPSTGRGRVVASTRLDPGSVCPREGSVDLAPMTIAIVELDEGPWIYAAIEGGEPGHGRVTFQREPMIGRFPAFSVS